MSGVRYRRSGGAAAVRALGVLLLALAIPTVGAQDTDTLVLSVEEIVRRVAVQNLEVIRSSLRIERARVELAGDPWYRDASVSAGAGYSRDPEDETDTDEWSARTDLTVPVVPQLSLGAGLSVVEDEDLEEELSITFEPFTPGRATYDEERELRGAIVSRRHLIAELALETEVAAYTVLVGDLERTLSESTLQLEQARYELALRRQEVGEASFLDVQEQQNELIDARRSLYEAEQRYLRAGTELQLLISPGGERIAPNPEALDELPALIESRLIEIERRHSALPVTEVLELAELDLAALEAELATVGRWRPEIELGATHALPDNSSQVELTFTFSPGQLVTREIRDLEREIEIARLTVAGERYAAELDRDLGARSIEIARQALESTTVQEEQDRVALAEGEILYLEGGRTSLQLEQLRLNVVRAEIARYEAEVELVRLIGEQLALLGTDR